MRAIALLTVAVAARRRPTSIKPLRCRGGDVVENAASSCKLSLGRAEELASLNEREHAAECVKVEGEAWSGDLEPAGEIPQTDKFAIPNWYLPDLDQELRNDGEVEIHVTKTPLFSQEECQEVIKMADAHASNAGGWGKIPAGRYDVHGGWVKDIVRSRRPAVLRRLHAIDAHRLQERMSWLVSFSILGPFGPRRETTMLRAGEAGHQPLRHSRPLGRRHLRGASPVERGPNGLKIEKETTHDLLSWRRRASMA